MSNAEEPPSPDEVIVGIPADSLIVAMGSITVGEPHKRFMGDGGFEADRMIWRYMSPKKFRNLIEHRALHFSRIRRYQDIFEGSAPPTVIQAFERKWRGEGYDVEKGRAEKQAFWEETLEHVLASCWHEKEYESVPMWERYCERAGEECNQCVAIVSTQGALKGALPERTLVSRVRYLDFPAVPELFMNPTHRAIVKCREYDDEHEVRAVLTDCFTKPKPEINNENRSGYEVPVDLGLLISKVVVSPFCDDIRKVIANLVRAARLELTVEASALQRNRYF